MLAVQVPRAREQWDLYHLAVSGCWQRQTKIELEILCNDLLLQGIVVCHQAVAKNMTVSPLANGH